MTGTGSRSLFARLFGSPPRGTELADDQAFLQRRVTLYTKAVFVFFVFNTSVGLIKSLSIPAELYQGYADHARVALVIFAGITLALGLAWRYLQRTRSVAVLCGLESSGTLLACIAIASTALVMPVGIAQAGLLIVALFALVTRAAIVPSTPGRTLFVGTGSSAALAIFVGLRNAGYEGSDEPYAQVMWIFVLAFGLIFAIATALVSRVIYGLQETVREAMRLGNYTLDHKLGEGGMGIVYLAHHSLLRRPTALKLLPPEKAGEQSVARFEREVQQTSRLTHPNTVAIYDFGRTMDGIFYYVMEYLDGVHLGELIELDGPQPPGRTIYVLTQVAHALAEAHQAGLVHRDVKPANIVLCDRGGVADMAKVVDFGLVKDVKAPRELALSSADALTGTPMYMAPETLIHPDDIDGRADLYALGAVGYFLVTGKHVFEGGSVVEICSHHLHSDPIPPSKRLGREVPADLEQVLLRSLAKAPDARYPDALALRDALLACSAASSWGLSEASDWWSDKAKAVQSGRDNQGASTVSGAAPTLAVDLEHRTEVEAV